MRAPSPAGVGTTARVASAAGPMISVFSRVPIPGLCRSGIQARRITKLDSSVIVPNDQGRSRSNPSVRTVHDETPTTARTIRAVATP
ncbi:hypothetical protein GCM10025780_01380 [Frondihabitans cladoniiphilus]|uniref:Uncharacterized protein n=1 Tax=Frondihabitans cladoniiphilus TaxID=715785 RepID=A0ABP8VIK9_9MICO